MGFRLIPKQERFFEMFEESAAHVVRGAEQLLELVESYEQVERKVRHIKDVEHDGDEATHRIFDALNRTFVTPLDRDDIARLGTALDDVLDAVDEAASRFHIYRIPEPTDLAVGFARVIVDQAHAIRDLLPLLSSMKETDALKRGIVELHRLENEADELLDRALTGLYDEPESVAALGLAIKWGGIYALLEEATDRAEDVAVALESILMKQS